MNRHAVSRWVKTVARRAGIGHVHPDKLRQSVATQAVNRGISIEALYGKDQPAEAATVGPGMRRLQREVHHRLLGNRWCQRPAQIDCSYESICKTCTHFAADQTFQPVLLRQSDHATENNQTSRAPTYCRICSDIW
ncbi:MAG: hypothetical protein ACI8Y4_001360 [Candidatus Poriferisodalaceae bacterium]